MLVFFAFSGFGGGEKWIEEHWYPQAYDLLPHQDAQKIKTPWKACSEGQLKE